MENNATPTHFAPDLNILLLIFHFRMDWSYSLGTSSRALFHVLRARAPRHALRTVTYSPWRHIALAAGGGGGGGGLIELSTAHLEKRKSMQRVGVTTSLILHLSSELANNIVISQT